MELRTFCRCTQTPNVWACVNGSDISMILVDVPFQRD